MPAAIAIAVFVVIAGALLGIGRPAPDQSVAGITDAPRSGTSGPTAVVVAPGTSKPAQTTRPGSTDRGAETPAPDPTGPPDAPGGPGPDATQAPDPTPRPTPKPTAPAPTPKPTPRPTPGPECTVPTLIGETATQAPAIWATAGFTGPITFDPPMQPNQRIGWQSLDPGTTEPCSSGITVGKVT
jgi:hypothetical protein